MKNNTFKKILCSTLAGMVLLLASCTPIDVSEESSEGNISGVIYHSQDVQSNASEEKSENASEMISESTSEAPSEEISEEVSIDVELKIPTTITADSVDSFFNDSIFVGNSIMLKYQRFVNKYRASSVPDFLGTSEFFCGGSFGVYHNNHTPATSSGAVNPTYKEKKYSVQDMVGVANP